MDLDADARADLARGRARTPLVRACGLAYLLAEKADLDRFRAFALDFGLARAGADADDGTVWFRTRDTAPFALEVRRAPHSRIVGFGLDVADTTELRRLASLPGASAIESVAGPGGGERVRLTAPNGMRVDAVAGRTPAPAAAELPAAPANTHGQFARVNATVRSTDTPVPVRRLGHVVFEARRMRATVAWLLQTFGLIISDVQELDSGPVVAFCRLDRGDAPTDHHTVAIGFGVRDGFVHAAFECDDVDAVAAGGTYLRAHGWRHAWGIGRHVLGSQIFDYWRDADGDIFEHYADGDLFDARVPTGRSRFAASALAQWGPPAPADFLGATPSPALVRDTAAALFGSEDVHPGHLARILAATRR